ncbi:hypothetical protein [Acidisoma silvae]|uniref:Uncharacterized protein n=1 Tax=Acidisoma silvae TaxID=2802396 RepID=A0A963YRM1_9PROT|nr:hypothetical protein [Acidisoma silvae]MCB8875322.1 hypothetical protein [Acidisoma silvae]
MNKGIIAAVTAAVIGIGGAGLATSQAHHSTGSEVMARNSVVMPSQRPTYLARNGEVMPSQRPSYLARNSAVMPSQRPSYLA